VLNIDDEIGIIGINKTLVKRLGFKFQGVLDREGLQKELDVIQSCKFCKNKRKVFLVD